MKLEYIRLINFRQFYKEQIVNFSVAKDLNVTVFHGLNGAGKTSLFTAINWCLYEQGVENIGILLNKKAWSETEMGQNIPLVVSIGFIHRGARFLAERVVKIKKSEVIPETVRSEFSLSRTKKSGDTETEPNPNGVMNAILPSNVRPYFFFDGEKMDDLTRAGSSDVQEAVRNIMRLPALERAQTHLQGIADELRREIQRKGSRELETLISREQEIRRKQKEASEKVDILKEEIRLGKSQIEDIDTLLRGTEVAKELQKRRDNISNLLKNNETKEKQLIQTIQKLANQSYGIFLADISQKTLEILDKKREKGEIPSGIREQFIKDLLERKECVCGKPFEEHDEAYNHLSSLLKRSSSKKIEDEVSRLSGNILVLSKVTETSSESIKKNSADLSEIKESSSRLYAESDDIERQLRGIAIDQIAELEGKRSRFAQKLEMNIAERGKLEGSLELLETQLGEIRKEREIAEKKEKELALLVRKEELAQRASDAVSMIKEQFFEQTRKEIELATKEVFSRLAWKQDHFQDVRLDQDFRLEVIDRWGMQTRKELSAGERQILSLAFITAMSKLSGEEAPLVMDTPFGRLSGNHLTAVCQNLPDLTPQLILFVTDREWDEASKTNLEPRTGLQYRLAFDEKTGCTDILEVSYE
jgi:DNA sulfur modification protein DndD